MLPTHLFEYVLLPTRHVREHVLCDCPFSLRSLLTPHHRPSFSSPLNKGGTVEGQDTPSTREVNACTGRSRNRPFTDTQLESVEPLHCQGEEQDTSRGYGPQGFTTPKNLAILYTQTDISTLCQSWRCSTQNIHNTCVFAYSYMRVSLQRRE